MLDLWVIRACVHIGFDGSNCRDAPAREAHVQRPMNLRPFGRLGLEKAQALDRFRLCQQLCM